MKIELQAIVKSVNTLALASGDKEYSIKLKVRGYDLAIAEVAKLSTAPADKEVNVSIDWE